MLPALLCTQGNLSTLTLAVATALQNHPGCKKIRPSWNHQLLFVVPIHMTEKYAYDIR